MFKKSVLAATLGLALAWSAPAAAANINFDPDGNTGALPNVVVNTLDWGVGNAVGVNVTANSPVTTTFQLFYQANLDTAKSSGGSILYVNNTGANNGVAKDSLTVVIGFQETIASSTFNPATNTGDLGFNFAAGGKNFFQIYANTDPGDNLAGACFVCGTLVMSGSVISDGFVSNFSAKPGAGGALDQANVNDYSGVNTIVGSGSVDLKASVGFYDTNWFSGIGSDVITFAFANANTKLPFQEIDPAACFFASTQTGPLLNPVCGGAGGLTGVAPFAGVKNVGALNGISGPNIMFQADGSSSFLVANNVPEPASLTLLGVGLLGSCAARRRRRNAAK